MGFFDKKDFIVPNIANAPLSKERISIIFDIFGDAYLRYQNLDVLRYCKVMSLTENTFRKMINHAFLVGILDKDGSKYHLSDISLELYYEKITYADFVEKLIRNNRQLENIVEIIKLLLYLFEGKLKRTSLVHIFSVISKEGRYDKSAISSVARNLRPILGIMRECKYICWDGDFVELCNSTDAIKMFSHKKILTVKEIEGYVNRYFQKGVTEDILGVVSTFENERYIWSKSSLYKNQGEICNLRGEYIMNVMRKEDINEY